MTVSGKMTLGAGLVVTLLLAVIAYHAYLVKRLAEVNQSLTSTKFVVVREGLQQQKRLDEIADAAQKLFVTRDPDYGTLLTETLQPFDAVHRRLQDLVQGFLAQGTEDTLERRWGAQILDLLASSQLKPVILDFERAELEALRTQLPEGQQAELELLVSRLQRFETYEQDRTLNTVDALRSSYDQVLARTEQAIDRQLVQSDQVNTQTTQLFWTVVFLALGLTLLVGYLTFRSINHPLRNLIAGTRAVAEGQFTFQLDESSGDEFSRLASSFNAMVRRLDELDQMKKEFLTHVSHELKTPLAAMRETNEVMLEGIPGPLNGQQERLIQLNLASAKRLSTMISKLLDLSRVETGGLELDLKTQDAAALLRFVAEELGLRAQERGLKLALELPAQALIVRCDGDRIIQVLENLVENALKYSVSEDTVHLVLARADHIPPTLPDSWQQRLAPAAETVSSFALIQVLDRGPGIPDDEKAAVFAKFHQVRRPQPKGGVGLGLAICREIVEAHGGAIWVADRDGGGSIFQLLLPTHGAGSNPARGNQHES